MQDLERTRQTPSERLSGGPARCRSADDTSDRRPSTSGHVRTRLATQKSATHISRVPAAAGTCAPPIMSEALFVSISNKRHPSMGGRRTKEYTEAYTRLSRA